MARRSSDNLIQRIIRGYHRLQALQRRGIQPHPSQVEELPEHLCLNCHTHYHGNFCPACGQSAKTSRLTLMQPIQTVLNILYSYETGITHSLVDLILRPGYMAHDYIRGRRAQYIKPLQLLFILAAVSLFLQWVLHGQMMPETKYSVDFGVKNMNSSANVVSAMVNKIMGLVRGSMTNMALFSALIGAVPLWLTVCRSRVGRHMNLVETFYANVYGQCLELLAVILCIPFELIYSLITGTRQVTMQISNVLSALILYYVIIQFYRFSWWKGILASVAYIMIMGFFLFAVAILAVLVLQGYTALTGVHFDIPGVHFDITSNL